MRAQSLSALASLASLSSAALLWDGRFNDLESAEQLEEWDWSNQVGPYQVNFLDGTKGGHDDSTMRLTPNSGTSTAPAQ